MKDYYPSSGDSFKANGLEVLITEDGIKITSAAYTKGLSVFPKAENSVTIKAIVTKKQTQL
jgi:hypothetical protein